jgi:predicted ABC-type transport system involved in lysophospholipase L1 biosynthesis ATPase subunit
MSAKQIADPAIVEREPIRVDAVSLRKTAGNSKKTREVVLLQDITLSISSGELVAIVGGSGQEKRPF